jgi:uncharacterized membrane protein
MVPAMEETAGGLKSCPYCAAQMPEIADFCPGCGRSVQAPEPAQQQQRIDTPPKSLAGTVAYVTFIPALIFLFVDPYRKNSYVRFHSLQSLLLCAAAILLAIVLWLLTSIFLMIPVVGPLVAFLVPVLAGLAALFLWLVLLVKAYQGERFKLPLIGEVANHYSETS